MKQQHTSAQIFRDTLLYASRGQPGDSQSAGDPQGHGPAPCGAAHQAPGHIRPERHCVESGNQAEIFSPPLQITRSIQVG